MSPVQADVILDHSRLSIAYIIVPSMFALDVFGHKHSFLRILLALAIHLIPSLVLIGALVLAGGPPMVLLSYS